MNDMDAEQIRTVMRAWKIFASGDADDISDTFTPDAEWLAPPQNATAMALGIPHHLVGAQEIGEFLATELSLIFL